MDLDRDGHVDILSGCYSAPETKARMGGYFYLLHGRGNGRFEKPEPVRGTDGKVLEIPGRDDGRDVVERICTRPTAADIDADGDLDLVVGNFGGSFYTFFGDGRGSFHPEAQPLLSGDGALRVPRHSDPFLVDWDGDGDLDLLSGSANGGAFLSINGGTKAKPRFGTPVEIVPTTERSRVTRIGDDFLTGPQTDTRVCVADVDGDGKLDLLLGDQVTLIYTPPRVSIP